MNKKIQPLYNWTKSLRIPPHILSAAPYPLIMRYIRFCLIILTLVMPVTACFPEKSEAIAAQEKEDGAMGTWETELTNKEQVWRDGLKAFKEKFPKLNDEGFNPNDLPEGELKTLFEDKYKPYFEVLEKVSNQYLTQNKNPAYRSTYQTNLAIAKYLLENIPIWVKEMNKKQMLKRIKIDLK